MRALPLLSRPPVKHGQAQGAVTLVALGSQALEDLDHVWESRSKLTGYKRGEGEKERKKETQDKINPALSCSIGPCRDEFRRLSGGSIVSI
jgi:hypothetical protein